MADTVGLLYEDALRKAQAENKRLRTAAERVCWFDWSKNDDDAVAAIEVLRQELKKALE